MSEEINIMEMAHKSVAFDNTHTAMRRWLCDNRNYDIIHLAHLRQSAEREWDVCDMLNDALVIYHAATFHDALIWALVGRGGHGE